MYKILGPWVKRDDVCHKRPELFELYSDHIVVYASILGGDLWYNNFSNEVFSSVEDAKNDLDNYLIECGYRIVDQETFNKLKILS